MIQVALDAMGGDVYPQSNILGAIQAVKEFNVYVFLIGDETLLNDKINKIQNFPHDKISVIHAEDVITMSDSPAISFRKKKNSSIHVGLNLVKEGKASAFVSAGNTGAVLTASTFILGRIEGVERPTLTSTFPSENQPVTFLDMGGNVDCKPSHLAQFAIMGDCFSKEILHVENPKVGLLNIGEEKEKGNALTQQTYDLLSNINFNFIGNIEGKALIKGKADVVVCDGFVGNTILKFGEGITSLFKSFLKNEAKKSLLSLIGCSLLAPAFKRFKKKFDYDEYGGAHFLGVNGVSIIAHGSASPKAIKNAIKAGVTAVESSMIDKIKTALEKSDIASTAIVNNES